MTDPNRPDEPPATTKTAGQDAGAAASGSSPNRPENHLGPGEAQPPPGDDAAPGQAPQVQTGDAGGTSGDNGPPPPPGKPRRGARLATALALFALLIALAAALLVLGLGWLGQQRAGQLEQRVATVAQDLKANTQELLLPHIAEVQQRVDQLAQADQQRAARLDTLSEQLQTTREQLSRLAELAQGGRRRWQLLEVEALLVTANERLQLYHDAAGAGQALALADARLARFNDPRLLGVRKKIIDAIAALDALPDPDIEGMALKLGALIEQVPQLPLASTVPSNYKGGGASQVAVDEKGTGVAAANNKAGTIATAWDHFVSSLGEALQGMFTLRHEQGSYRPLMPPEQSFFLYQNLLLKLQTARLALLQRHPEAYRANLESAQHWLKTFFDTDDPAVSAAIEQIGRLQKSRIDWEAPDISASLIALRDYLQATKGPQLQDGKADAAQQEPAAAEEGAAPAAAPTDAPTAPDAPAATGE